ncbi:MAG: hypothetical protein AB7V22_11200 [Kiritimatiellia bacterium]
MDNRWIKIGALGLVLALAAGLRFADLSRSAVRSDEINFLNYVERNQSLVDLWKTPPWFNQIPLADSVPIVWARLTRQAAGEAVIRQPFALLGWLTVAFGALWATRRRGLGAGLLLGAWLAILPFHVYHSREAYYYVLAMGFASGLAWRGADFAATLKTGGRLRAREYAEWTAWALLACMSHMSVWVVAGVAWLLLAAAGWAGPAAAGRKRHGLAMGIVTAALALGMVRWVLRALYEMKRAAADPSAHIGSAFDFVGPRVLPFFAGGANAVGIAILAAALAAAGWVFWTGRGRLGRADPLYGAVAWMAFGGLAGSYLYITAVGGGDKAKLAYFAANLPAFLAFAAFSFDRAFAGAGAGRRLALDAGVAAAIVALLAAPAAQVVRLEGKTTAYRALRAWLDASLAPGDAAVVDRWYEPWNEMARYAPSNVFVTFTVPDEPYENYVGYHWRKTTQTAFERNEAQAFIRIARNHEKRAGLWTWPEKWFAHRAVVTNAAGAWLRDTGFAPMEEFYSETNRVETEIFYDTHADVAARARAAGQDAVWFFGAGWRLFKPWQQGDFADYRVLEGAGELEIHNLRDEPLQLAGEVVAAAMGGEQRVRIGDLAPLAFPEGRLERRTFALDLPPGVQILRWKKLGSGGALLVREFRLGRAE